MQNFSQQQPAMNFGSFAQPGAPASILQQFAQPQQQFQQAPPQQAATAPAAGQVDLSSFANFAAQNQVAPAVPQNIQAHFQQPANPVVQNPNQGILQQFAQPQQAGNPYGHLMVPGQAPLQNMLAPQQAAPAQFGAQPQQQFPGFGQFPQTAPAAPVSGGKKKDAPAPFISLAPPPPEGQYQAPVQQVQQAAPVQQAPAVGFQGQVQQFAQPQQQYQPPAPVQHVSKFEGILFFGSAQDPNNGFLAPRFPAKFRGTSSGLEYIFLEQYIWASMAGHMDHEQIRQEIMALKVDAFVNIGGQVTFNWQGIEAVGQQIQALKSKIKIANQEYWEGHLDRVTKQGLLYKFLQLPQQQTLISMLMKTGSQVLVWADADPLLGIGMTEQQARVTPVSSWGKNILGTSLMTVRHALGTQGIEPFAWAYTMPAEVTGQVSNTRTEAPVQAQAPAQTETAAPVVQAAAPAAGVQAPVETVTAAIVDATAPVTEAPKAVEPAVVEEVKHEEQKDVQEAKPIDPPVITGEAKPVETISTPAAVPSGMDAILKQFTIAPGQASVQTN